MTSATPGAILITSNEDKRRYEHDVQRIVSIKWRWKKDTKLIVFFHDTNFGDILDKISIEDILKDFASYRVYTFDINTVIFRIVGGINMLKKMESKERSIMYKNINHKCNKNYAVCEKIEPLESAKRFFKRKPYEVRRIDTLRKEVERYVEHMPYDTWVDINGMNDTELRKFILNNFCMKDGKLIPCGELGCIKCEFFDIYDGIGCIEKMNKWLNEVIR